MLNANDNKRVNNLFDFLDIKDKYQSQIQEVYPVKVFTKFIEPLTEGICRSSFENARVEYWARKHNDENPEYWEGKIFGVESNNKSGARKIIEHAWVVVDGKIVDSTLFKIGFKSSDYMTQKEARFYWGSKVEYRGNRMIIDESVLKKPLDYFCSIQIKLGKI